MVRNLWTVPFKEVYSLVLPLAIQNDNKKNYSDQKYEEILEKSKWE
jgi:hypothetical protein